MEFLNKVFHANCLDLLPLIPDESVDAVISDPMFGVSPKFKYDWGSEPARGSAASHWRYHRPIYEHCLRVLKPAGVLAWAQGFKFFGHFPEWFGGHRIWSLQRCSLGWGIYAVPHVWIVQTKDRQPMRLPDVDALVIFDWQRHQHLRRCHPCPKTVEEMEWLVSVLTKQGDIVLDPCCGLGSTVVAAKKLGRRYIGSDLSGVYSRIAVQRLMIV